MQDGTTRRELVVAAGTLALGAALRPLPAMARPGARQQPVSAAEWTAMLRNARRGGTIELGDRRVEFARFRDLRGVTVRGGAFGAITLDQWRDVTFVGSRFEPRPGHDPRSPYVIAYQPDGLRFDRVAFTGGPTADGQLGYASLSIRGGNAVSVVRSTFRDMSNFMAFARTSDVQVTDNVFSNIREGVQLVGVDKAVVARNRFGPYRPAPGDHADGVQLFTNGLREPGDHGARNVLIEHNLIDPGEGRRTQGIFIRDEAGLYESGRGYAGITIRDNLLIGTGWHGISAMDPVADLRIEGNRLLVRHGADGVTSNWILVRSGGGTVRDNVAGSFQFGAMVEARDNRTEAAPATAADIRRATADWSARWGRGS